MVITAPPPSAPPLSPQSFPPLGGSKGSVASPSPQSVPPAPLGLLAINTRRTLEKRISENPTAIIKVLNVPSGGSAFIPSDIDILEFHMSSLGRFRSETKNAKSFSTQKPEAHFGVPVVLTIGQEERIFFDLLWEYFMSGNPINISLLSFEDQIIYIELLSRIGLNTSEYSTIVSNTVFLQDFWILMCEKKILFDFERYLSIEIRINICQKIMDKYALIQKKQEGWSTNDDIEILNDRIFPMFMKNGLYFVDYDKFFARYTFSHHKDKWDDAVYDPVEKIILNFHKIPNQLFGENYLFIAYHREFDIDIYQQAHPNNIMILKRIKPQYYLHSEELLHIKIKVDN